MEHHNKQLQQQLKVYKQNEQNKTKAAVGGTTTHGSGNDPIDDFMDGFDSY
jgi:hypothetical protein